MVQTQVERDKIFGLSETLFNPIRRHLYVRGYAFFSQGMTNLELEFADRPPVPARQDKMQRNDLLKIYPTIDSFCGFEFFLPEFTVGEQAGQVQISARLPDGSTRRLNVQVDAETQQIAADITIQSISVDRATSAITVVGELLGDGVGFIFSSAALEGHEIYALRTSIAPEILAGDAENPTERRPYTIKFRYRAAASFENAGLEQGAKPAAALNLEIRFCPPRRGYSIPAVSSLDPATLYLNPNAPEIAIAQLFHNRIRREVAVTGTIRNAVGLTEPSLVWDGPEQGGALAPVAGADRYQTPAASFALSAPAPGDALPFKGRLVCLGMDGQDIAAEVTVSGGTTAFDSDFQIDAVSLAWFGQHLQVRGMLLGAGEPELCGVTVDGLALALERGEAVIAPSRVRPRVRQRVDFVFSLRHQVNGTIYQIFAGPGSEVKLEFRRPGSDYCYTSARRIPATATSLGLGQIAGLRYAPASQNLEVTGSFFGHFGAARVHLTINGERQHRSASVEQPNQQPDPLEAASDAPFCRWTWCDRVDLPAGGDLLVEARVSDGAAIFAEISTKVQIAKVPLVEEPLAPSYHVSPLRDSFDTMMAEARRTSPDPTVAFVFPGDMAAAFGGGPTRVLGMGRYFRAMGFRTVLVDRSGEGAPTVERTDGLAQSFDMRLGLPGMNLDEVCNLCLDEAGLGDTSAGITEALKQAAARRKLEDPGDLISRRTNHQFDAASAFLLTALRPDVVIAVFAWTADILALLPPSVVRILDTHDLQHRRGAMHAAMFGDESLHADRDVEIAAWAKADYLIAIQPEEREAIIEISGRNNVVLCGHGADVDPTPRQAEPDQNVLFVGNRYGPNIDGITRFIREAWPPLQEKVPGARLQIVGTVGDALTETAPGVEILGRVDDLQEVYSKAAVVINPVNLGTGVSIKLIEALCNGRAILTTPVGMRGVPGAEAAVMVTEIPEMADALAELLTSPEQRRRLEAAAIAFARKDLVPEAVFRELFNTIELRMYS